jgi:hypothetical protein
VAAGIASPYAAKGTVVPLTICSCRFRLSEPGASFTMINVRSRGAVAMGCQT